jgi:hypothetical protein
MTYGSVTSQALRRHDLGLPESTAGEEAASVLRPTWRRASWNG